MHINEVIQEPLSVRETAPGVWLADFGQDAFGWVEVELSHRPQETYAAIGEVISDGRLVLQPGGYRSGIVMEVYTKPGRRWYPVCIPPHRSPYEPGQRSKVLPPENCQHEIAPFRYAEAWEQTGLEPPKFRRHAFFAPFNDAAADFHCSDDNLNRVWDFCKYSIKATTAFGIYVDGERERQAFEGDSYVNALGHYCSDADYRLAKRTLDFLIEFYPIAAIEYQLLQPILVRDYLMYSGDRSMQDYWLPELKERLKLDCVGEDGLYHSKALPAYPSEIGMLVDWPPWNRDSYEFGDTNFISNAFLYAALQAMAELTGDEFYVIRAARVKDSIRKTFLRNGHFIDHADTTHSSFHANLFALRFGLAEGTEIPCLMDELQGRGMVCSVYCAQFLLETCFAYGHEQYGIELMRSNDKRSWLNMMKQGATITMESWGNWDKANQDWCHAWGAAPANIIPRWLCGIRPLKPGFEEFIVDPKPGNLEYFTMRHPTSHGPILLEKTRDNILRLTVPLYTQAIFRGQILTPGEHEICLK